MDPADVSLLAPGFPGLEAQLARLQEEGLVTLFSSGVDAATALHAELRGGLTRIRLMSDQNRLSDTGHDLACLRAQQDELQQLRGVLAHAPLLAWREDREGAVIWANGRYLHEAADRLEEGRDLGWPLPRLFDDQACASAEGAGRHRLGLPDGRSQWFDLTRLGCADGHLGFALPVDDLVRSEETRRQYKRVISGTFANLPIGLAIFDSRRHLVQFNPALVDMCKLPTDFLLARPTVFGLLDALRDRNMIPEPKDYRAWRQSLTDIQPLESHEEIWNLPSGQTYRMTGRPYPDGALALMFEDISSEVSRLRRYHADIELNHAILDSMSEAVAVFSTAGQLIMTNRRYADLWDHAPAESLGGGSFATLLQHWKLCSAPAQFWTDAESFVADEDSRGTLTGEMRLLNGRSLACQFSRLPGRDILARFSVSLGADLPAAPRDLAGEMLRRRG